MVAQRAARAALRAAGVTWAPGPFVAMVPCDDRARRAIVALESAGFASPTWLDLATPAALRQAVRPVCVVACRPAALEALEPVVAVTEELGWATVALGPAALQAVAAAKAAWRGRGVRFGLDGVEFGERGVGVGADGTWAWWPVEEPDRALLEAVRDRDAAAFIAGVGRGALRRR